MGRLQLLLIVVVGGSGGRGRLHHLRLGVYSLLLGGKIFAVEMKKDADFGRTVLREMGGAIVLFQVEEGLGHQVIVVIIRCGGKEGTLYNEDSDIT